MTLPLKPPFAPMEARSVDEIPIDAGWQYEPKWDGFRCLAFRDSDEVYLQSKSGQPLARYFPDVADALSRLPAKRFILDGELVIQIGSAFSFDELQLRLHPAASRVRKLAAAYPAMFVVFDLLAGEDRKSLVASSLRERRRLLEIFARKNFAAKGAIRLSPATTKLAQAKKWFEKVGGNLDGVIAKQIAQAMHNGSGRTSRRKIARAPIVGAALALLGSDVAHCSEFNSKLIFTS